jgi:DNA-binding MarR family transcriptional regulator
VTDLDRTANVLGALALVLTDRIAGAAEQSPSAAAALTALHQFLDRPTVDRLRRVLGLTPSGAVRLVDRLAEAGLVTRGPGVDGRSRSIELTPLGQRAAGRIAAARAGLLTDALAGLSRGDRDALDALLGKVMANVVRGKDGGAWICRMCDLTACGRDAGRCPTANVATEKYRQ